MEERRERAHHHLRLVDRQRVDELDGLVDARAPRCRRGDAWASVGSSAATVPGLPSFALIMLLNRRSKRAQTAGSYSLSTFRSMRRNSTRLSRRLSGISISV